MTERWKIVVLIIVVILALIFAFFGGLAVGQRNAPSDNKTTKTDSNGSLERKAEENSSKNAEETALADEKASQKDNPKAKPQSEKNSEDKKSADSQGSTPKTDTPDTIEDITIKGNYAPNSIGHVLLSRKSRRKTVTLEADNEEGNSETATVTDTDSSLLRSAVPPKYTLSTTQPIRLKLAQLHINRLNALGHNAYLVNVRDNDDNRSMVFMRIGQYTTRMEAKKVAFSLLSLDNTRFEVFRIASSAKN